MIAKSVTEHVFRIPLRMVNAFLIVLPDSLTLVDAGTRKSYPRIASAITELGRRPEEVTNIVVTHLHADHTGALAEARAATGARVWMHPEDARLVRGGESWRPVKATPRSLVGGLFVLFGGKGGRPIATVPVDHEAEGGREIPVAAVPPGGGLLPIWTPGHTVGHLAYLWPHDGGVLFVGDAAGNSSRLRASPIYEDYEQGLESLRALGRLDFQVACFAHGKPIVEGAAAAFAGKWGRP
jgi:glyoxylase-like metal-dependent hydrolase (beta-lactamase superfamily II)